MHAGDGRSRSYLRKSSTRESRRAIYHAPLRLTPSRMTPANCRWRYYLRTPGQTGAGCRIKSSVRLSETNVPLSRSRRLLKKKKKNMSLNNNNNVRSRWKRSSQLYLICISDINSRRTEDLSCCRLRFFQAYNRISEKLSDNFTWENSSSFFFFSRVHVLFPFFSQFLFHLRIFEFSRSRSFLTFVDISFFFL